VNAGLRLEQGSPLPTRNNTTLFPSITVAYDAAAKVATLRENLKLDAARLRAGWWRAGNEVTGRTLASTYVRRGSLTAPTVGVNLDTIAGAEQTTGIEVGAELMGLRGRIAMDINLYSERSDQLVVPILFPSGDSAAQSAGITNRGIELQLRGAPFRNPAGFSWDFAVSFGRNANRVDQLAPGVDEVALAPSLWGASSIARVGHPLGLIVGTRYLRDPATQALLLENGLPLPDLAAGLTLFGSWQPDWTGSFRSSIRYRIGELAFCSMRAGVAKSSARPTCGAHTPARCRPRSRDVIPVWSSRASIASPGPQTPRGSARKTTSTHSARFTKPGSTTRVTRSFAKRG